MSHNNIKSAISKKKRSSQAVPIKCEKDINEEWVGLSFRVSPEWAREFKVYAAQNGYKLVELLKEGFVQLKTKKK